MEEHPASKAIKKLAKDARAKRKAMTNEEKRPYMDRAAQLKVEHEKTMEDIMLRKKSDLLICKLRNCAMKMHRSLDREPEECRIKSIFGLSGIVKFGF
ncbi:uncharacterized protein LOC141633195 [Silene latifolia]|uniref:uncharacterized protein LOC141633195 n=1 Tax=Silene latifolia TaxID=37657 RepID=UPI003D774F23